jgi:hypothetical protein
MKRPLKWISVLCTAFGSLGLWCAYAQSNGPPERIGIYDSRLVAYAHFHADSHLKQLKAQIETLKAAKVRGDTNEAKRLDQAIRAEQLRSHRQVFSTVPVDDVLAQIKDRLPEIQKEAGVSHLVSKWDEKTLEQHRNAERVDVTDLLVREFHPGEKQLKVIAELKHKEPVPLDEFHKPASR